MFFTDYSTYRGVLLYVKYAIGEVHAVIEIFGDVLPVQCTVEG